MSNKNYNFKEIKENFETYRSVSNFYRKLDEEAKQYSEMILFLIEETNLKNFLVKFFRGKLYI